MKPFQKPYAAIFSNNRLSIIALFLILIGCKASDERHEIKISTASGDSLLKQVSAYMNTGDFERAQGILITAQNAPDSNYSATDRYYFHSHLAEIMYYTAINEQGLQNAREAMRIGQELKNDTLIGNAENLLGLIHLNSERYDSALHYFNRSLQRVPPSLNNPKLSRYDQILGNISEAYLKSGIVDKAIEYAQRAQEYSIKNKVERAIMLNNWTLAEAWLMKNDLDSCSCYLEKGLQNKEVNTQADAQLFLLSTAVKLEAAKRNNVALTSYLNRGIALCNKLTNFDFAVSDFLQNAVSGLLQTGDYKAAASIQNRLNAVNNSIQKEQENLHMRLLNAYYQKESELSKQRSDAAARKKENQLNRLILFSLVSLVVLLVLFIVFFRRWMNQRRKTELLQFKREHERIKQEQELNLMHDRYTAIEAERNRIARELHDDIGSSLSSISIFADLALTELSQDTHKATTLLERVKQKNQEVSDTISDLIWAIYSKNDTMGSLITRVRNFGFDVLTAQGIELKIEDDFRLKDATLSIELKKNLLLFFKEALNNIAKYSKAKQVIIVTEFALNALHIRIADNGSGFDPKLVRRGNGIAGFQARAHAIGGKFTLDSKIGEGTQLLLSFPFSLTDSNQTEVLP